MRPSLDSSKFDEIVNPAFSPQGVLVREFVFRMGHRRNGADLLLKKTNFEIVF